MPAEGEATADGPKKNKILTFLFILLFPPKKEKNPNHKQVTNPENSGSAAKPSLSHSERNEENQKKSFG